MEMDMNRSFVRSTLDADHRTSAYKIVCRQCGKTDKIAASSRAGTLPPDVSAKKFKQRGWTVGSRVGDDLCNICVAANKIARKQPAAAVTHTALKLSDLGKLYENQMAAGKTQTEVVPEFTNTQEAPVDKLLTVKEAVEAGWAKMDRIYEYIRLGKVRGIKRQVGGVLVSENELRAHLGKPRHPPSTPLVNEPAPVVDDVKPVLNDGAPQMNYDPKIPPEMTKEDRRIIFSEIDLHYLDESRGYENLYDDKRIAEGLKVPMAWVRTIREDNFGPERGEVINAEVEKLKEAKAAVDKSIDAMRDLWEEINKSLDAFVVRHNDLSNEAKKSREAATAMMIKIDGLTRK
jgi:hypothetical protein